MALHDPVEDALNERKRKARLVEAGAAVGSPNEAALNITRKFLEGGRVGRFGDRTEPDRVRGIPENPLPFPGRRVGPRPGPGRRVGPRPFPPGYGIPRPFPPPEREPTGQVDYGAVEKFPGGQIERGVREERPGGSLAERYFDLPGPVGFAKTAQGQAILQRILGRVGRRGFR